MDEESDDTAPFLPYWQHPLWTITTTTSSTSTKTTSMNGKRSNTASGLMKLLPETENNICACRMSKGLEWKQICVDLAVMTRHHTWPFLNTMSVEVSEWFHDNDYCSKLSVHLMSHVRPRSSSFFFSKVGYWQSVIGHTHDNLNQVRNEKQEHHQHIVKDTIIKTSRSPIMLVILICDDVLLLRSCQWYWCVCRNTGHNRHVINLHPHKTFLYSWFSSLMLVTLFSVLIQIMLLWFMMWLSIRVACLIRHLTSDSHVLFLCFAVMIWSSCFISTSPHLSRRLHLPYCSTWHGFFYVIWPLLSCCSLLHNQTASHASLWFDVPICDVIQSPFLQVFL